MSTRPPVSVSSPAMQCMSVDLPDPDGPMIAVRWRAGMSTVTSSRARTAVSAVPYTLVAPSARAATRVGASVSMVMGSSWRDRTSSLKGRGRRVVRSPTGLRPTSHEVGSPTRCGARTPTGVGARHARSRTSSSGRLRTLVAMRTPIATDEERRTVRRRARVDALIVVVVGFIEIVGTAMAADGQGRGDLGVAGVALLALGVLALPFRHKHPVAVLWWVLGTTLAYWSLGYPRGPVFFALLVALFQVVLTGHRRVAIATLVFGFLAFSWLGYALGRDEAPGWGQILGLAAWLVALLSITELVRSRRDRARDRALAQADLLLRQASDERIRIARELHDAVAHNMSLINIQAGVALHLMDDDPRLARDALTTIKGASKEALVELRSILGVLRGVDDDAPRAPAPSLQRLPDLVANAAASGVAVDLDVEGDVAHLPRSTDLAAFRIVQESLTNVARHAGVPDAEVRVRVRDGVLALEILDEGTGRNGHADLPSGGNGIPGMQERALAVGGRLTAGPRPGRGFVVRAELPIVEPS